MFAAPMVLGGLNSMISGASDLNETVNKSSVIFGKNAKGIDSWAKGAATSMGLSREQALNAAAGFGDMFSQIGFSGDAAAKMSKGVVQMSADLGSFNNIGTDDVAQRISAAFRGEYDSLQTLIPNINAARVEQEAMATTGKKNAKELTAQEKAAAVLAIVNKDGSRAMGDFARTSDGVANKQKILSARMADARAKFGALLLPVKSFIIDGLMKVLSFAPKVGAAIGGMVTTVKGWFAGGGEGGPFSGFLTALKTIPARVQAFVAGVVAFITPFLPQIRAIFTQVTGVVTTAMQLVWTVVKLVITGVMAFWNAFGTQIVATTRVIFGAILGVIRPALALIQAIIKTVMAIVKGDWSGAWDGIKAILAAAWSLIKGIITGALAVIKSVLSTAWSIIKAAAGAAWDAVKSVTSAAWDRIKSAVSAGVDAAVEFVKGLPGKALAALGDLGSMLWNAGASLIQGLIDGIMSKVRAVTDAVSGIASKIKGFFGGSPVEEGPLLSWNNGGAGKRLGGMLAEGLDASRASVAAASSRLAGAASVGATTTLGTRSSGPGGSSGDLGVLLGQVRASLSNLVIVADGREIGRLTDTYQLGYAR